MRSVFKYWPVDKKASNDDGSIDEGFVCSCCYCDYESNEIVEMPDCGHKLCFYCFQSYL